MVSLIMQFQGHRKACFDLISKSIQDFAHSKDPSVRFEFFSALDSSGLKADESGFWSKITHKPATKIWLLPLERDIAVSSRGGQQFAEHPSTDSRGSLGSALVRRSEHHHLTYGVYGVDPLSAAGQQIQEVFLAWLFDTPRIECVSADASVTGTSEQLMVSLAKSCNTQAAIALDRLACGRLSVPSSLLNITIELSLETGTVFGQTTRVRERKFGYAQSATPKM